MSTSQILPTEKGRFIGQMTFETIFDAREGFYALVFAAHDFIVDAIEIRMDRPKDWTPSSALISRQKRLQTHFRRWHSALEHMTQSSGRSSTRHEMEAYSFLHVAYGHYFILLATGLNPSHPLTVYCRNQVSTPNDPSTGNLVTPKGAQIENTWRADAMTDVTEWTVGIEESGNIHGVLCAEPSQIELPPENHRVQWDQIAELQSPDSRPAKFHQFQMWQQDENHA
ncbi:uncharacterized protein Z519_11003 [Cladophialophora bantiana CBS 173.52]|uniref:Uncharacterized protein n=1 Tax=Cladophialophora bantiana (strain ATCC 10958 / CBS 173.52 / CDC B-1940 / NIH 8579) TaxID=1442370 RepID=A0A0D2HV92_CLAB1|nr:uncharacterized protein Z519_11003 [Cladophialophora bantiana CBS 173.52]KIW88434.1 hypothetical protein Z519_11003 [Cladophialophora bantiana CBS 173.52]